MDFRYKDSRNKIFGRFSAITMSVNLGRKVCFLSSIWVIVTGVDHDGKRGYLCTIEDVFPLYLLVVS